MYQFNEQFAAASRQFADTAAQINKIALENVEAVFGLQLNALQDRANATFAFFGEAAQARDLGAYKALFPKGVQVARENIERTVAVGQDVYGRTLKANEAIGQITKAQLETVAAKTQATVEEAADKVVKAAKAK
ncbi:phasin family protein [Lysobacter solisilvae (ex Woo and Kim 2020)]|uniref:Phasin family protein n=1 Tax=Agrilutibacter terrestris TaxID=2865112 RepID=A0A7H0FZY5_9GAMM|nr:phasin family protein [Lysobacter terrestris]QNP41601.1 phasin family protein [Lysobacter terrestris]